MNKQTNILYRKNNETKEKINARSNQRNEGEQRKKKTFQIKENGDALKNNLYSFSYAVCKSCFLSHFTCAHKNEQKKLYIEK